MKLNQFEADIERMGTSMVSMQIECKLRCKNGALAKLGFENFMEHTRTTTNIHEQLWLTDKRASRLAKNIEKFTKDFDSQMMIVPADKPQSD